MQQTLYGRKKKGSSRFVVVAPHGLDDLFTDVLTEKLGELLYASIVINDTFMKPSNILAEENGNKVQDFNKLPWNSDENTYVHEGENSGLFDFNVVGSKPRDFSPIVTILSSSISSYSRKSIGNIEKLPMSPTTVGTT
ncbi:hypothetical protein AUK10_03575 [Candidatus Gracilibacteria bacterium CG2_30_37_12]|nr:MAG: hypothetical protein AUK10_03575 [Candidatus Gracilibacteria bacterium CG2_30_37_12]